MAGRNGPEWSDWVGREERTADEDGNPVVVRVTAVEERRMSQAEQVQRALRTPGWSMGPTPGVRYVEVKNRPEDPTKVRRRLERQLAEREAARAAAAISDEERSLRRRLAELERSS